MKNVFLLILVCVAFSAREAQAELNAGLLGGLNFANLNEAGPGSTAIASNASSHGFFGLYAQFPVAPQLFIEPELRCVRKGAAFTYASASGSRLHFDLNLRFVELALYAKYKFLPDNMARPYLFAGPNFGVKVNEEISVRNASGGSNYTGSRASLVGSAVGSFDWAFDFGAGVEFALPSSSYQLHLSVAESYGFKNIDNTGYNGSLSTRGLQLYAGLGRSF